MASEDIERLKERVEKDPDSKLFVPLAEEYKKEGMLDEAIEVLVKGLERQPGYLSARVSLGKIYIERHMLGEARDEFEKVISAIPDNLYAHKKLAEIYKDLGEKESATKELKTVLRLNPMDEWAASSLSEIGKEPEPQVQEQAVAEAGEMPHIEEEPVKAVDQMFEVSDLVLPEAPSEEGEELEEVREGEEETPAVSISEEDFETEEETMPEISLSEEDRKLWEAHTEAIKGEETVEPEISAAEEEPELWKPHSEQIEEEEAVTEESAVEAEAIPEEEPISFKDIFKEEETVVKEKEPQKQAVLNINDADQFILQGQYFSAMNIYKKILSGEPENTQVLQRVEELKTLLKILGKDKEELIARLNGFLEGIKKRRDEFSGSP